MLDPKMSSYVCRTDLEALARIRADQGVDWVECNFYRDTPDDGIPDCKEIDKEWPYVDRREVFQDSGWDDFFEVSISQIKKYKYFFTKQNAKWNELYGRCTPPVWLTSEKEERFEQYGEATCLGALIVTWHGPLKPKGDPFEGWWNTQHMCIAIGPARQARLNK